VAAGDCHIAFVAEEMRSSFAYVVNDIKLTAAGEVAFENKRPDIQDVM